MPYTLTLPGSRMENVTDIETISNVNTSGQFVYRIDSTVPSLCSDGTIGEYITIMLCIYCTYVYNFNYTIDRDNYNCFDAV